MNLFINKLKTIKLASDDLIHCGSLICPKETVRCFSSSSTRNSETVHFAQCIDENGHILLGNDKPVVGDGKVPKDLGVFVENLFNNQKEELEIPSHIHSTPIANTELPLETKFEYIPAVESAAKQILDAQKSVEFWKNYVQRINLSLQGLSKSLKN